MRNFSFFHIRVNGSTERNLEVGLTLCFVARENLKIIGSQEEVWVFSLT